MKSNAPIASNCECKECLYYRKYKILENEIFNDEILENELNNNIFLEISKNIKMINPDIRSKTFLSVNGEELLAIYNISEDDLEKIYFKVDVNINNNFIDFFVYSNANNEVEKIPYLYQIMSQLFIYSNNKDLTNNIHYPFQKPFVNPLNPSTCMSVSEYVDVQCKIFKIELIQHKRFGIVINPNKQFEYQKCVKRTTHDIDLNCEDYNNTNGIDDDIYI